jgi:hypothetical protein
LFFFVVTLLATGLASSETLDTVTVGDLPGTDGRWQVGEVTLAAPADEVQRWFTDASKWPQRFPDDEWARDLGRAADGTHTVQFHSSLLGRTLTTRMHEQPGLIVYDATGEGVTMNGKVFFEKTDGGHTKVIIQTSAEVHGGLRLVVGKGMKRKKALQKIRADLDAAVRQSKAWAAANRWRG